MADDGGGRGDRRRDENSVRVTNLSEDVSEADLYVGGSACLTALTSRG